MTRYLPAMAATIAVACGGLSSAASANDAWGEVLFQLCAACHGDDGEGNQELAAPTIAGLDAWYVKAQLIKFRTGVRGMHAGDAEGMRMRPMSLTLGSDEDVEAVTQYVASLPQIKPPATLTGGDPVKGKTLYAPCTACHGPSAEGNPLLNGPPLSHLPDWYQLSQIKKFQAGMRGVMPEDATGILMRPMSFILADEQAIKDVIAHIVTLSN